MDTGTQVLQMTSFVGYPTFIMSSESEERVRQLCRKLCATAHDSPNFSLAVTDLRTAVRQLTIAVANESGPKTAD